MNEDQIDAALRAHAACHIVTRRQGEQIWSCGVHTPAPEPESTVGYVDLYRRHVARALAEGEQ